MTIYLITSEIIKERPISSSSAIFQPGGGNRCRKCDFEVLEFSNFAWADGVDYMFFRNMHPNKEKLRIKLKPKEGYTSYCCQCGWETVEKSDLPTYRYWSNGGGSRLIGMS